MLYLSARGRVGRFTWWTRMLLPLVIVGAIVGMIDGLFAFDGKAFGVWSVVALWPAIAITIKRWHDHDKSAWWLLVLLVPVIGSVWNFVLCGFLRGTVGPNRYGA